MAMNPTSTAEAVSTLYEILPAIGVESDNMNVSTLAPKVGVTPNQLDRIIRKLEGQGALTRRIVYTGNKGKQSFWTLNVTKDEAIALTSNTTLPDASSLRSRILAALTEKDYESVYDLMLAVRRENESIDLHNITHVIRSLRQQGKVSFKVTTSGRRGKGKGNRTDNIPYGISLINKAVAEPLPEPTPEPESTPEPDDAPSPMIAFSHTFPLIMRVVMRREFLERAALLAEQGGEADLALSLMEKAEVSLTPFEQEVVALWNAYQECKG